MFAILRSFSVIFLHVLQKFGSCPLRARFRMLSCLVKTQEEPIMIRVSLIFVPPTGERCCFFEPTTLQRTTVPRYQNARQNLWHALSLSSHFRRAVEKKVPWLRT